MLDVGVGGTTPGVGTGVFGEPLVGTTEDGETGTRSGDEDVGFAGEFEGGTVPVSALEGAPVLGSPEVGDGTDGLGTVAELLELVTRGD